MTNPQQPQQQLKLIVRPGTPAAVRRQELDSAGFMDVRILAYTGYKNPDQTPLMTYAETLDHRGMVKQKILHFEMANGWVTPDGTETQPFSDTNPNADTGAQMSQQTMMPGMPMMPQQPQQMQMPMMPQQQPQQMQQMPPQSMMPMAASPAQMAQVPQQPMMPPGMSLPGVPSMPAYAPPMQAAPPQTMQPQAASPAQAAEAAQQQPAAAAPGKRRGGRGSQVAVPPPPPPNGAPPQQMMAPQQMMPPQQFAPPPGMQMPQQPMQVPVQNFPPQPQQQMAPQPQAAGLEKLVSDLGRGLEVLSKNNLELSAKLDLVARELADTKMLAAQALGALHHIYIMGPPGQNAQGQAMDLPSFQNFLGKYLGSIGKPNPK